MFPNRIGRGSQTTGSRLSSFHENGFLILVDEVDSLPPQLPRLPLPKMHDGRLDVVAQRNHPAPIQCELKPLVGNVLDAVRNRLFQRIFHQRQGDQRQLQVALLGVDGEAFFGRQRL